MLPTYKKTEISFSLFTECGATEGSTTGPGDRRLVGAVRTRPRRSDPERGASPREWKSRPSFLPRPSERIDSPEIRPEICLTPQWTRWSRSLFRPDSQFRMEKIGFITKSGRKPPSVRSVLRSLLTWLSVRHAGRLYRTAVRSVRIAGWNSGPG